MPVMAELQRKSLCAAAVRNLGAEYGIENISAEIDATQRELTDERLGHSHRQALELMLKGLEAKRKVLRRMVLDDLWMAVREAAANGGSDE